MSDILINGMKMPTTCAECRLSTANNFNERPLCDALVEYMSYGEWQSKRLDNCPLVPVSSHGRCIDADNLLNTAFKLVDEETFRAFRQLVIDAPTIIPAEEGE